MRMLGVNETTSQQSTNSPDTQRRMIPDLHGDKHDEPHGRWLLEELVIVRIYVEFAKLSRDIKLEERRQERSRIDHCEVRILQT